MKRLDEFLNTQHNLKASTKINYQKAIKAYDAASKTEFEDSYLDAKTIHTALEIIQKKYSPSSWNTWLTCQKRYAKYLSDPEDEECPKVWQKIRPIKIDWEEKLKNKWLSEEEFMQLMDKVSYARDKALYGVAWEGALRPGELLALKIRDCRVASYGFDVSVSGKTGTSTFPVVLFAPLLRHWLNLHPNKHIPEASLWPTKRKIHDDPKVAESYYNATLDFQRYARLAKITKPVSLHILRHSKITLTAKNNQVGVSDEMAKKMFRWKPSSRMYSKYTHLHNLDASKTFLALAGIKEKTEEKTHFMTQRPCLNCNEINSPEAMYCFRCGAVLDPEEAKKQVEESKKKTDSIDALVKRMLELEKKIGSK